MARKVTAKFRYNAALPIAGVVALCGAVLAGFGSRWYLAFVLLVPLAVIIWGIRAGVDVRDGRLVVRRVLNRRIDPARIVGFTITHRAVRAVLDDESTVWLPAVPGTRVPVLAETVGLRLARDHTDPTADAGNAGDTAEAGNAGGASTSEPSPALGESTGTDHAR